MHMQYAFNTKRYINLACRIHLITETEIEQLQSQHASLTLIVLMWRIGWAHNNARK